MTFDITEMIRGVTDAEVHNFRNNGWVKLEKFLQPELASSLLATAHELLGSKGDKFVADQGPHIDFERFNDYHYPARDGIEPCKSLTYSEIMGRNAQRLMGRDIGVRYYADQLAARSPRKARSRTAKSGETEYHQDYPARQFDRVGNIVFWIALNHVPAERGAMRFLSGSNNEGSLGYRPPDLFERYPYLLERYPLSAPMDLAPGDATAHSQNCIHGAPFNSSDETRWHYAAIYIPADVRWTGAEFYGQDAAELQPGAPFDDPAFPIVVSGSVETDTVGSVRAWRITGEPRPAPNNASEWDVVLLDKIRTVRVEGGWGMSDRGRTLVEGDLSLFESQPLLDHDR